MAKKPPVQALSVLSYHDDSPPFQPSTERHPEIPALDLDEGPQPADHYPDAPQTPPPAPETPIRPNGYNASWLMSRLNGSPVRPVVNNSRLNTPRGEHEAYFPASALQASQTRDVDGDPFQNVLATFPSEEEFLKFPRHRLKTRLQDEAKTPIIIVACGSFSPPTYLHLRMFEMAKDTVLEDSKYEILGGYYSPVSDRYKKSGLAPAVHRVRMCELAVEYTSTWLMVDPWEASQPEYQRTAVVLEHFDQEINGDGGVELSDGSRRRVKVLLLAGGDLIESFGHPGVWSEEDMNVILGTFGVIIVERTGSDVWAFLLSHDILYQHRNNIVVVKQLIYNDISSTKVRLFVKRGMSIKYLLPNSVIQYIYSEQLYGYNP